MKPVVRALYVTAIIAAIWSHNDTHLAVGAALTAAIAFILDELSQTVRKL